MIVYEPGATENRYWDYAWKEGEAHCGPWRKQCRALLGSEQVSIADRENVTLIKL